VTNRFVDGNGGLSGTGVVDSSIERAGLRPVPGFARPMIVTTMRWFSAARLAHALAGSGFVVSACRPRSHPLGLVGRLAVDCELGRLRPLRSVANAIRRARPDIILPGDERALALLRRLHARTDDPDIAALIERSLGEVNNWPAITSRTALAHAARLAQVAAPETAVIGDAGALDRWASMNPAPFVLKTDGSWGGDGVAIVRGTAQVRSAWRTLANPPSLLRAAYRLFFDREARSLAAWARRVHPTVNAQRFVEGREGIVTAACVDGEIQALVCLEVVTASEARGPASVVRVIEHEGMAEAARRLISRFGLTGFCGFDFIVTATGDAQLLELNPRLTPTSYLLVEEQDRPQGTIALFPPDPGVSPDAVDRPTHAPTLLRYGDRLIAKRGRPLARLDRWLKRSLNA
jgi:hypothetical protein